MNPITSSAQAFAVLSGTDWPGLLHMLPGLLFSALLAFASAVPVQAALEGFIASFLPGWLFFAKPFLPSLVGGVLAKLLNMHGLPGADAVTGGVVLAWGAHWIHSQPWAVKLEGSYPKVWSWIKLGLPKVPPAAKTLLLGFGLGLLACASSVKASVTPTPQAIIPIPNALALGFGLDTGEAMYQEGSGGTWVPAPGTMAGLSASLGLGTWEGQSFADLLAASVSLGFHATPTGTYLTPAVMGGVGIPGTSAIAEVGAAWHAFSGQQPLLEAGANFFFGPGVIGLKEW